MKKKITLTSVFAIFLSIAATILMSCLIFVHQSNQKLEKEIKNYLHIASQLYNGENDERYTQRLYLSSRIRVLVAFGNGKPAERAAEKDGGARLQQL